MEKKRKRVQKVSDGLGLSRFGYFNIQTIVVVRRRSPSRRSLSISSAVQPPTIVSIIVI
jgi:hypothetical protein